MDDRQICQSCSMALGDPAFYGTNEDDSRNEDYCIYCYAMGEFTEQLTLDDMVGQCMDMIPETDKPHEEIEAKLREQLSGLKRWKM